MLRRVIFASILALLAVTAAAQTTTYTVVAPYSGGRWGGYTRAFSIYLSGGSQISWLQTKGSCDGTTSNGFLFSPLVNGGACTPLLPGTVEGDALFDGGSFEYTTILYHCGYGGKGGSGTCFQITGGTLTLTQ